MEIFLCIIGGGENVFSLKRSQNSVVENFHNLRSVVRLDVHITCIIALTVVST